MGNVLFSGNAPLDESRLRPFWDVIPAGLTALLVANLLLMGKLATARIVLSTRDELDKEPQNEQLDTSRSSNEWHLLFQKVEMAALATKSDSPFAKDLKDLHLVYDYNVRDAQGNPEKWRYEIWFFSEVNPFLQIIFADSDLSSPSMVESRSIQDPRWADGRPDQFPDMLLPMHQAGRALAVQLARRYDSASEALSPIAIVATTDGSYSLQRRALSSPLCKILPRNEERRSSLSPKAIQGHWDNPEAAHGDKRNAADFERWRGLARIGIQTDRHMLPEQADIVDVFRGKGDLEPIEQSWPTL